MEHLKMTNENFLRNRGNIYWTFRIYKDLDYIYYVLSIVGIVVGQYAIYSKSKICLINKMQIKKQWESSDSSPVLCLVFAVLLGNFVSAVCFQSSIMYLNYLWWLVMMNHYINSLISFGESTFRFIGFV